MSTRPLAPKSRVASIAARAGLGAIAEKVFGGGRLTLDEVVLLYRHPDLNALGALANFRRESLHGDRAYFNVNQHINYTNICNKLCRFCAFQRLPGQTGAYVFSPEVGGGEDSPVRGAAGHRGPHGGRDRSQAPLFLLFGFGARGESGAPGIHVKAFTMVEIEQIQKVGKRPLEQVFADLIEAGLGSLPGAAPRSSPSECTSSSSHSKSARRAGSRSPARRIAPD